MINLITMLRKAVAEDFEFLYRLYMHPQVNRFLLYEQMDADSFLPIVNDLIEKEYLFIYEDNNKAIGMCKLEPHLYRNSHIVYLGGVAIHPSYSGKGEGIKMVQEIIDYAKEKKFLRIELSVASVNGRAIRLYEKAGFAKEGVLKKFTYLKNENKFLDELMMAYLF